jgi:hypothetical protein
MECGIRSYLEPQLSVESNTPKEFETMVQKDFKGPGPYPAHSDLPVPSSGPFAHPKPSTSNIPTATPSLGPGAPPCPPSTTSSVPPERSPRRSLVGSYPTPTDVPQLPTPPSSHLSVPSPANSMSSGSTLPNYEGDSVHRGQHDTDTGQQHLHSHEAYLTQDNVERSSARCLSQVEHRVRVRSPVRVVKSVAFIPFVVCPPHYKSFWLPIVFSCLDSTIHYHFDQAALDDAVVAFCQIKCCINAFPSSLSHPHSTTE